MLKKEKFIQFDQKITRRSNILNAYIEYILNEYTEAQFMITLSPHGYTKNLKKSED